MTYQQNNSGNVYLTRILARLTPLSLIEKRKGKASEAQKLERPTDMPLKEVLREKSRTRKKIAKLTKSKVNKSTKRAKKNLFKTRSTE